ncbi:MAG: sel1 repeat family protein, partial [Bacteroidaceae bacterium]|nr:sel1 repeat family protein [Bacteroidaceae bacterium]
IFFPISPKPPSGIILTPSIFLVLMTVTSLPKKILFSDQTNSYIISDLQGKGVKENHKEAIKYYMLAAEQNDTEALNTLGYCYYSGTGVVRNYEKAVKYFRQSAELGNDKGELNLANCYYGGKGVKKDLEKAKHLFESAAKKGNREAKDILKVMKF